MTKDSSSHPEQPSIRRQLWQAKRNHRRNLRLALASLGLFLGLLTLAGALGWLSPRGKRLAPPPPVFLVEDAKPKPAPAPAVALHGAPVLPSLFRNEEVAGLVWRREGAEELEASARAFWPEIPAGAAFFTLVQGLQSVCYEASWVELQSLSRAKMLAKDRLSAAPSGGSVNWVERQQCWTTEDGTWGCALIPQGPGETRVLLRKRF